jgi:hypothetical protein
MKTANQLFGGFAAIAVTALVAAWSSTSHAQQNAAAVAIDNDDIAGVVTSPAGPEAGVWVIADTSDFQTRFSKIVVTDDRGRYVIPDLPEANYSLWVRGYGLADSAKVSARRGRRVNHRGCGAERRRRREGVSGDCLVLDDAPPDRRQVAKVEGGMDRSPSRRTAPASAATSGSAYAHDPEELGRLRHRRKPGCGGFQSGQAGQQMTGLRPAILPVSVMTWRNGATGSRPAQCRRSSRPGPRASSATWSSPCGTG